ncbi:hypothetical protein BCR33DRAFT_722424 [Rhizoclosmatium globosum]|uniref:Uncharacterized protein n=1 Tax=Rhizoclosmatium globosum TaxID=329046 RepID=A0A1Y2BME3_9FUNG|nr:hypothetical protein BCR33DRAFT_722424 [Rhizoclosmatium globosum]|eukprot:ORY35944.1 hypothetical protein BCR33DRAFT_722424 [Rhizoclosmatium globosum]
MIFQGLFMLLVLGLGRESSSIIDYTHGPTLSNIFNLRLRKDVRLLLETLPQLGVGSDANKWSQVRSDPSYSQMFDIVVVKISKTHQNNMKLPPKNQMLSASAVEASSV